MKTIGTEVGFQFDLPRVSLSDPRATRSGRGVIVDNQAYMARLRAYAIRVIDSPDYPPGSIVHVRSTSLRQ